MIFLYNLAIRVVRFGFSVAALFHPKARAFVTGRKDLLSRIAADFQSNTAQVVWVHCASLGEFEQGRPVMEAIKNEFPAIKIVLTFFSPSGYEVRKQYATADHIYYLPWDTHANARKFLALTRPVLAIFVKYEFWYHYSAELRKRNATVLSISSIFRKNQLFFRPYGGFYRSMLGNFSHFFVQNDESIALLKGIGIGRATRSGDTRFDRVYDIVKHQQDIAVAERFKSGQKVFVIGSCWPEDLEVLIPFINENKMKFIIAPHEISESFLVEIERVLQVKAVRYSQSATTDPEPCQVLIIDNIGLLSRLYRYGEFAYIGGAFGKGLHNILEAACYGVPIFFGNRNFEKFREAVDLINRGGAFEVADYPDFKMKYELVSTPESFLLACEVTRQYVEENLGATEKILQYCRAQFTEKAAV